MAVGQNNIAISITGEGEQLKTLINSLKTDAAQLREMLSGIPITGAVGGGGFSGGGGGSAPMSGTGAGGVIGSSVNPTRTAATPSGRTSTVPGGPPSMPSRFGGNRGRSTSVSRPSPMGTFDPDAGMYFGHVTDARTIEGSQYFAPQASPLAGQWGSYDHRSRPQFGSMSPAQSVGTHVPVGATRAPFAAPGMMGFPDQSAAAVPLSPWDAARQQLQGVLPGLKSASVYGRAFGLGGLYAVGGAGASYLSAETQSILTGRGDQMQYAGAGGSLAGGVIGAGIGSLFGGFGGVIGAGMGSQVGSMFSEYLQAQNIRNTQLSVGGLGSGSIFSNMLGQSISTTGGSLKWLDPDGGMEKSWVVNPTLTNARRFGANATRMQNRIRELYDGVRYEDGTRDSYGNPVVKNLTGKELEQYTPTATELSSSFSTLTDAFVRGGMDPTATARGFDIRTQGNYKFKAGAHGSLFRRIAEGGYEGSRTTDVIGGTENNVVSNIVRNAAMQFLTDQSSVVKEIAPIIASSSQHGNNLFDILQKYGSNTTSKYATLVTPFGEKAPSGSDIRSFAAMTSRQEETDRVMRLASTQVRGVGGKMESSLRLELDLLDKDDAAHPMLGIKDSEAYGMRRQQFRSARKARFQEEDIENFGIPGVKLQGEIDRAELLPFSPGMSYGLQLRKIGQNAEHLRTLNKRYSTLKNRGELSEQDDLAMNVEMQSLQTSTAQGLASIANGAESRLPALSAGRARWFGRFNSLDLTAQTLGGMGHPASWAGATNGRQLQSQDQFVQSFALPANAQVGYGGSTTQGLNSTNALLSEILRELRDGRRGGSNGYPNERLNNAYAVITSRDMGTARAYDQNK